MSNSALTALAGIATMGIVAMILAPLLWQVFMENMWEWFDERLRRGYGHPILSAYTFMLTIGLFLISMVAPAALVAWWVAEQVWAALEG